MKVRLKRNPEITGYSNDFNTHSLSEIVVYYDDDGDASSEFITDYDVLLSNNVWKDMRAAFQDNDLVTDNYETRFREPVNYEERKRGWYED